MIRRRLGIPMDVEAEELETQYSGSKTRSEIRPIYRLDCRLR